MDIISILLIVIFIIIGIGYKYLQRVYKREADKNVERVIRSVKRKKCKKN